MSTITTLFQQSVQRFTTRAALLEPTEGSAVTTLTYEELQQRVHDFAGYLQSQKVKSGDKLIIWSPSSTGWMIGYLGALLTGLIIVPLDVNTRADFLECVASATHATMLLTTQKHYKTLKDSSLVCIDIDALPTGTFDATALPAIAEENLAEIVFTSGTTGNPKGVMLTHKNIVSNVLAAVQVVDIRTKDRALSILPLSHMFELTIEIALLYCGSSILYTSSRNPDTLLKLFNSQHVTCMALVPQALQLLMNGIEKEVRRQKKEKQWKTLYNIARRLPFGIRRYLFRAVHARFGGKFRFFFCGGAYLSPDLAQRWEDMGFKIVQGYGATETAPIITATPTHEHNLASVGKALPGVEVRIAPDKEVLARGHNISPGYLDNPEATAAAFRDGWYYTGDLGELDAQGNLYLKGRKKNIIVLANGLNVYPEDVENILNSIPGVKDSVVIGLSKAEQGPEVHGVLLLENPEQAKAIIQQANKRLALQQQIKGFTVWPEQDFPRTHTLKVKRQDIMNTLPTLQKK